MSARPGLYGGQPAMAVPTVINSYPQFGAYWEKRPMHPSRPGV